MKQRACVFGVLLVLLCSGVAAFPELMNACDLGPDVSLGGPHKHYSDRDDMFSMTVYEAVNSTESAMAATVEPGMNYTLVLTLATEGCGTCIVTSEGAQLATIDFFYTDSPMSCNGTRVDYHHVPVEVEFRLVVDEDSDHDVTIVCDFIPHDVQHTAYLSTMTLPMDLGDE